MNDNLRKKLEGASLTPSDVLDLLVWQLSLPAADMDCDLISECDLFLDPASLGMDALRKAQMHDTLASYIRGQKTRRSAIRSPHRRRMTPRRMAAVLLALLMLLAFTVGAVAYFVRRGVLNFNDDWGWLAPLTYLDGAEEFITTGTLYHQELEHVTVDVIEAVTDGADLRIVYSVTNNEGIPFEGETGTDYVSVPGAEDDGVHMCDYIIVNGQDAYFDDAWQSPGDVPGQALYYLQSSLPAWGVDISGEEELHLGLPMIGRVEYIDGQYTGKGLVQFTIPAKIPEERMKTAELLEADMDGHAVTVTKAVFSPLNGYAEICIEGLTEREFALEFTSMGEVYGPDGYALSGADIYGTEETESGFTVGFTMYPPADGWPDMLVLAMERNNYQPDWEAVIRVINETPSE